MRSAFEPQTRVPGASRRIDPGTLMPMVDKKGRTLWNMPAPVRYAEHIKRRRDKETGERVADKVKVPIYRGTSAAHARHIIGEIRRQQRKSEEYLAATLVKETDDGNE